VGHDVEEVLAALANVLTPDGASKEDAAARTAVVAGLEELYERFLNEGRDFGALETMSAEDIKTAVESCVVTYVYNRWLGDLGLRIEQRAVSASDAIRLEREMRSFIREAVHLDIAHVDVIHLDWGGPAGRAFVDTIYRDAYSLFGGGA
jgi:hypothetical protein